MLSAYSASHGKLKIFFQTWRLNIINVDMMQKDIFGYTVIFAPSCLEDINNSENVMKMGGHLMLSAFMNMGEWVYEKI